MGEFPHLNYARADVIQGGNVPESRSRKQAEEKKKLKSKAELAEQRSEYSRLAPANRNWVPAVFIPMGLLGVAWMVTYNLAGDRIGFVQSIGDWLVSRMAHRRG